MAVNISSTYGYSRSWPIRAQQISSRPIRIAHLAHVTFMTSQPIVLTHVTPRNKEHMHTRVESTCLAWFYWEEPGSWTHAQLEPKRLPCAVTWMRSWAHAQSTKRLPRSPACRWTYFRVDLLRMRKSWKVVPDPSHPQSQEKKHTRFRSTHNFLMDESRVSLVTCGTCVTPWWRHAHYINMQNEYTVFAS